MKFNEASPHRLSPARREFRGHFSPNCSMASRTRNSVIIFTHQHIFVECAGKRAAADERRPESYSFLLGKTDHFDSERKPSPVQFFQQSHSKRHSEHAVERTGVGHRIEM